jgi:hypothetical protein
MWSPYYALAWLELGLTTLCLVSYWLASLIIHYNMCNDINVLVSQFF